MGRKLRVALGVGLASVAAVAYAGRPHPPAPMPACSHPRLVVHKHEAQLELICDEGTRRFPVTFGADPVGAKQKRGDERTPEGRYTISAKVKNDRFHRFLKVSYPNADDLRRAHAAGVDPGGGIGIHGVRTELAALARLYIRSGAALSSRVWGPTDGCIGMVNEDVELVYDAVPVGTRVDIQP
jgi:murein L,D-transpeptidase YafK